MCSGLQSLRDRRTAGTNPGALTVFLTRGRESRGARTKAVEGRWAAIIKHMRSLSTALDQRLRIPPCERSVSADCVKPLLACKHVRFVETHLHYLSTRSTRGMLRAQSPQEARCINPKNRKKKEKKELTTGTSLPEKPHRPVATH